MSQTKAELIEPQGNVAFDTNTLYVDADNNRVGIGTTSAKSILTAAGNIVGLSTGTHSWQHYQQASSSYTVTSIDSVIDGAAGNLVFKTGPNWTNSDAVERARIDSSGRLLVGTSSSTGIGGGFSRLEVENNYYCASFISRTNDLYGPEVHFGKSRGGTTIAQNGDSLGAIIFNGADGTDLESVGGWIQCLVDGTPGANDMPGRLVFATTADGASSPTERVRITQDGDVFINHNSSTSPIVGGEKLGIVGAGNIAIAANTTTNTTPTLFLANTSDTTNAYVARFSTGSGGNTRGEIYYNGSQLVYATSSDYRLKENVVSFNDGIEIVKQLRPVRYNWIENGNEDIGFIAHEVQAVFPNAVGGEKDAVDDNGKILPQTYDPSKLVPLLTAALQEAIGEIESLKARVAALESA